MQMTLGEFVEAISTRLWETVGRRNWRAFNETRSFVHGLGLTTSLDWKTYARSGKRPPDIPVVPAVAYRSKGWLGWRDWLGRGRTAPIKTIRGFAAARAFVRSKNLTSFAEWRSFAKSPLRPADIPTQPWKHYAKKG